MRCPGLGRILVFSGTVSHASQDAVKKPKELPLSSAAEIPSYHPLVRLCFRGKGTSFLPHAKLLPQNKPQRAAQAEASGVLADGSKSTLDLLSCA